MTTENKVAGGNYNDLFSIHTITFISRLTSNGYTTLYNILCQYCDENHCGYYPDSPNDSSRGSHNDSLKEPDNNSFKRIRFGILQEYGVNYLGLMRFEYAGYQIYCFTITVNLRRLHGIKTYPYICIVPGNLISQTLKVINKLFCKVGIFPTIDAGWLNAKRIDFCTNIRCSSIEEKEELMRVARKGRSIYHARIKKFYSKSGKRRICPDNSFTLTGAYFEFTVYDKHSEIVNSKYKYSGEEIAESELQIRIELRVKTTMIDRMKTKSGAKTSQDLMEELCHLSQEYISSYLEKVYPASSYFYRFRVAKKMIMDSGLHDKTKMEMIDFMKKTTKRGLDGAISWYEEKYNKKVYPLLSNFRKLDICPITLPKESPYDALPGFAHYIKNCNMNHIVPRQEA